MNWLTTFDDHAYTDHIVNSNGPNGQLKIDIYLPYIVYKTNKETIIF